jgi:tRNA (guanine-N7-)-methyltransferase
LAQLSSQVTVLQALNALSAGKPGRAGHRLSSPAMTNSRDSKQPADNKAHRRIRSFVLRTGRMTPGQRRALEELWPLYGVEPANRPQDPEQMFKQPAPVTLEIGFGNGDNLVAMAAAAPERNFLGIEVHEPGVGHCLLQSAKTGVQNLRVMQQDAVEVLGNRIPDASLDRINLFFPDPWSKKRHHKRRIVQPEFVQLLARKLRPGGMFHVATDWPDYAEHIAEVMTAAAEFNELPDFPQDRITTRFDTRGQRLGHTNWERAWCTRSKLPIAD